MFRLPFVSDWRREALRTNLWLVPAIEVALAIGLYVGTHAIDLAAAKDKGVVVCGTN